MTTTLKKAARDKGFAQLQQRAGTEQTLPEMSVSFRPAETFDQDVGAESDQLTGRLTRNVSGTMFPNLAYNDLVGKVLEAGGGNGMLLSAPVTVETPGVLKVDGHKVVLRCDAHGRAAEPRGCRRHQTRADGNLGAGRPSLPGPPQWAGGSTQRGRGAVLGATRVPGRRQRPGTQVTRRCGQGRVLGIDAGERRVGVALSDELRLLASPLCVLDRARGLAPVLDALS